MTAVVILHARNDMPFAAALSFELNDLAPVRVQLSPTPPRFRFGDSVVRVAIWSGAADAEGVAQSCASMLSAAPDLTFLVGLRHVAKPDSFMVAETIAATEGPGGISDAAAAIRAFIQQRSVAI